VAIATVMTVTLSTDHRCVDGALGAELLGAFKGYIENPMSSRSCCFIWSLGIGVLSLLVGVVLVADPLAGAIPLTLLVAVLFLATGVAKTMFALALRPASGWVWVLASGLVSVVLGVMILAGLPATATTILGLLLGIELVSNGVLFLFVALGLRRLGS
jgi:uncharacterized membrane protein HdeD (DUF308 family)